MGVCHEASVLDKLRAICFVIQNARAPIKDNGQVYYAWIEGRNFAIRQIIYEIENIEQTISHPVLAKAVGDCLKGGS